MTASMLSILESSIAHARSWVSTGDESRFDFSYDFEGKRALGRGLSMTNRTTLTNTLKIMVLVMWGVDGPALIAIVPQIYVFPPNIYANWQFPIWTPT
jgi:hypothetical protein